HAVGCERGVPFYVMQFIEGRSLAQVIAELRDQERGRTRNGDGTRNGDAASFRRPTAALTAPSAGPEENTGTGIQRFVNSCPRPRHGPPFPSDRPDSVSRSAHKRKRDTCPWVLFYEKMLFILKIYVT